MEEGYYQKEFEEAEMDLLSGLSENIVYRLPGCSDLMIRKTIQDIYRDFCRLTSVLHSVTEKKVEDLSKKFHVSPKFGGIIDAITEVWINRKLLDHSEYVAEYSGTCVDIEFLRYKDFISDVDNDIRVDVVELPNITSEKAPRWFIQKYGDAIVSGVLFKLMYMSNKPWSDPQQAEIEKIRYENFLTSTKINSVQKDTIGDSSIDFAIDMSGII